MEESKKIINTGLRGVTVASTRISHVDGEAGKLIYRGYPIFDLSDKTTYEEIVHLFIFTGGDQLDPSVRQIAHIPRHVKSRGDTPRGVAEAHALHAAFVENLNRFGHD